MEVLATWVMPPGRANGRGVAPMSSGGGAGEVSFEGAEGFFAGFAFFLPAGEVGDGWRVVAALGDGDAVQRAVELAVAAAVQAMALAVARGGGDWCDAGGAREFGVAGEAPRPGGLGDDRRGGHRPAAG